MPAPVRRRSRWLFLPLLAVAAGLIAAACGGGDVSEDEFAALQSQVADLQTQLTDLNTTLAQSTDTAQRALLFAILPAFDAAAFHTIDEQINNDGLIHQTAPGIVRRAVEAIHSVEWPPELQAHVDQFGGALESLLTPVLDDDAEAAGRPATVVHGLTHSFEEAVNAYLAGEEVPAPPAVDVGAEHDASGDGTAGSHDEHAEGAGDEE